MNELIDKIEECIYCLLKYDTKSFGEQAQSAVNMMMSVFPAIISIYSDPGMADVKEDAVYWPAQLERILKALENDDSFELIDVLYNETRTNLMELRKMLTDRGIA